MVTRTIVLTNLAELGHYRNEFGAEPSPPEEPPAASTPLPHAEPKALADALNRAVRALQGLSESDAAARRAAEDALERYDRVRAEVLRLKEVVAQAAEVSKEADDLSKDAFLSETSAEAERLAAGAAATATIAQTRLEAIGAELAGLQERAEVSRLLAERRSREEARRREERIRAVIKRAEALASEHKLNEAQRLLGSELKQNPNEPFLASSYDTIARRVHAVKTLEVERVLAEARRLHRREPARAADILGELDLAGMPSVLVRDVYGCWLAACRRLGLIDAVHYSPGTGRGAILVPSEAEGRLAVVSAVGLRSWTYGRTFAARALRGARPLT